MAYLNRITRTALVVFATLVVAMFAVHQYAKTLTVVPPINYFVSDNPEFRTYLLDLNRGTVLRDQQDDNAFMRAPDGNLWARGTFGRDADGAYYELSVARYPNQPQVLGTYRDVMVVQQEVLWSRDGQGIYFLRRTENADGILLMYIDVETGEVSEFTSLETFEVPQGYYFPNDTHILMYSTTETLFVNTETQETNIVKTPQGQTFTLGIYENYFIYVTTDPSVSYLKMDTFNIMRMDTWEQSTLLPEDFSTPPVIAGNFPSWSPDDRFTISLSGGNIAIIDPATAEVEELDMILTLTDGWSHDGQWLLGTVDTPDRINRSIVAYNVETGEQIELITGKQPEIEPYGMEWSPVDNTVLLYNTGALQEIGAQPELTVAIYDIPSGDAIFETMLTPPDTDGFVFIDWSYEWFTAQYDNFVCMQSGCRIEDNH